MTRSGVGRMLARFCIAGVLAVHLGSCGGAGPTTPTPPPPTGGIQIVCPASLLVGQTGACSATATGANGQVEFITFTAAWSVTPSEVAEVDGVARVTGRTAGTATVRVSYGGKSATADVVVRAEDGLVVTIGTTQASGKAGEPAAIGFSGWYSVVSADSGTLEVVVRSADGRHIATAQRDVTRGGGAFLLENKFQMPAGVGSVCGIASLRISGRFVEPTGPVARPICINEVPP